MNCIYVRCINSSPYAMSSAPMQCLQLRCNVFSSDASYSPLSQCVQSVCNVFRSFASAPVHMQRLQPVHMQCVQSICNVFSSYAMSSCHLHQLQSIYNVSSPYATYVCLQVPCNVFRPYASTPVHMQYFLVRCIVFCSVAMSAAPVRCIHLSDRMYQTPANCCNLNYHLAVKHSIYLRPKA